MITRTYTPGQIAKMTGLKLEQVQFYTKERLIAPEPAAETGRGYIREYSLHSARLFVILAVLVKYGIKISQLREIINATGDRLQNFASIAQGNDTAWMVDQTYPVMLIIILKRGENPRAEVLRGEIKVGQRISEPLGPLFSESEQTRIEDFSDAIVLNLGNIFKNTDWHA